MKALHLFILALIAFGLGIAGLRINSQKALELRNQIIQRDQANKQVDKQIEQLREYVFSHMNSSVQFELTASYNRAVDKAKQQASTNETGQIYARAQAHCDRRGVSSVQQAECVQQYVEPRLNPGENPKPVEPPKRSEFRYAFAAPTWTPDFAGFSLLAAGLLAFSSIVVYVFQLIKTRPGAA